jgi:hypothetical protein
MAVRCCERPNAVRRLLSSVCWPSGQPPRPSRDWSRRSIRPSAVARESPGGCQIPVEAQDTDTLSDVRAAIGTDEPQRRAAFAWGQIDVPGHPTTTSARLVRSPAIAGMGIACSEAGASLAPRPDPD